MRLINKLTPLLIVLFASGTLFSQSCPSFPVINFSNPVMVNGPDRNIDAVYKYSNITTGVDARVTITNAANTMTTQGGVRLATLDNSTAGFGDAFQPTSRVSVSSSNPECFIEFKVEFFVANNTSNTFSSTPYTFDCLTMGIVDNDGVSNLRERISVLVSEIDSVTSGLNSQLNSSVANGWNRITGPSINATSIDTIDSRFMAQVYYSGVSQINFRVGAIHSGSGGAVSSERLHSVWFKSFANVNIPLSMTLASFEAARVAGMAELKWITVAEKENAGFAIEKSADGNTFLPVGEVSGAGNTIGETIYSFLDPSPYQGMTYYRLRQVDFSGKSVYSGIVTVRIGSSDEGITNLMVSPNPFNRGVELMIPSDVELKTLLVTDIAGRVVYNQTYTSVIENPKHSVDLSFLQDGVYVMSVNSEASFRLIKSSK